MIRAPRFLFCLLFSSVLFFTALPIFAETPSPSGAELEKVLQKIDSRHYRWIAIRADVFLFFAGAGNSRAMCGGELVYQRLEERLLLTCADAQKEVIFVFRAFDRRFDLFIPSRQTVYHGSIFDMENSPEIESHLKARDLYRALKPLTVDPRRAKLDRDNPLVTSIDVYGREKEEGKLLRKLYLSPEGDVRGELFYDPEGRPVTEIRRYDFQNIPSSGKVSERVIFPKKITILSPETQKGSAIFFSRVKALDDIGPLEFALRLPFGTKEVFLDRKDSSYQTPQKSVAKPLSTAETVSPVKIKSAPKKLPPSKVEKTPEVLAVKKEAVVPKQASPSSDADIVAVAEPGAQDAASDASLDPSVEPKA